MKSFFRKYIRTCPKTGKVIGLRTTNHFTALLFPFTGLAAILWILFRVLTKPSRITYPCVRVAMPIASTFIGYILIPALTVFAWMRARKRQVAATALFAVAGLSGSFVLNNQLTRDSVVQFPTIVQPANQPIGTGVGIFPGRVVWAHDSTAVNQNCVVNESGHGWFMSENMHQPVVDNMLSSALHSISGTTSDSAAWSAIFQFYNNRHGKGLAHYTPGEKIFIKVNATSAWWGEYHSDLSVVYNNYYGVSETSEATVLAVLKQLVNVVGVAQSDIYIGDPMKHIYKHNYDVWHGQFPNVHYLDHDGYYSAYGREQVVASTTAKIHYSDNGTVLRTNDMNPPPDTLQHVAVPSDYLYTIYDTADYVLNIPMLKGHQRAGMTMFAKDNFGSQTRGDASHLHWGLVRPYGATSDTTMRPSYGMYRVQVDLMTSKYLSGKNLLYIMDALWATSYELDIPRKWQMSPFNNTFMSSIFVSQDPVAIESVGYDFLRSEFTTASGQDASVQMPAVDDYLHQAADSLNWPAGIKYDPDSTGVHIQSLGVHEHWDNAASKQYSVNKGTGNGIELVKVSVPTSVAKSNQAVPQDFMLYQNYPNPFNPSTAIKFYLSSDQKVSLKVFDIQGREIETLVNGNFSSGYHEVQWFTGGVSSGVYFCRLQAGTFTETRKMIFAK